MQVLIRRDPVAYPSPPHMSVVAAHWLLSESTTASSSSSSSSSASSSSSSSGGASTAEVAVKRDRSRPPLRIPPQDAQNFQHPLMQQQQQSQSESQAQHQNHRRNSKKR